ncbi:MAG: hypothetical protein U0V72_00700 [Cytophagales bacterium]
MIIKTIVSNGYNANKVVDFVMTESEFYSLTEFACLAGSTVRIVRSNNTSYVLVKKSNNIHTIDQFVKEAVNRDKGIICFGDSRAANEYYESPTVTGKYKNNCGILNWTNAYLYQSLRITYKGVAGNTYADLVNRYDSDISPLVASNLYLYVICSINDVLANKSSAQIIADMESLYNRAIEDNLIVIEIADYHPAVGKELTAAQRLVFNEVQRYKKIKAKSDNFIVIDSFALIGNTTSTTPNVPTSKVFDSSSTGLHINAESACVIGKKLATELAKQISVSNQLVSTVTDTKNTTNGGSASSSNIVSNSLFIGTAGTRGASNVLLETTLDSGYTATVASLWNIKINSGGGTCYTSVGPGIDGIGFSQRMRITGTTAALETYQMSLISAPTSLVTVGKQYIARCLVKITACVALHTVMLRIVNTVSGTVYQYRAMSDKSPQNGNLSPGQYIMETPVCDNLSVAPSNFEVQVLPIFSAAGGSATIDISQLECIQLP